MNFKFVKFGSLLFLLVLATALVGSAVAQPLSLYDAVQHAAENYPLLAQRKAELAAGRAHIKSVNDNRLPSLMLGEQITAGTDNALYGGYFSLGVVASTPGSYNQVHNSPNAGNNMISFLKWEVYNCGLLKAQQQQAKAQFSVAEAQLQSSQYQLSTQVVSLYLDWLKKYRLVQVEKDNVDRAGTVLTNIRAHALSGLVPGTDSNLAHAAYSNARIGYLQAVEQYNFDRITLAAYTGLVANALTPDTTILTMPSGPLQMLVADSVGTAHPLVQLYEKQYEAQLAENKVQSKKYMPKLELVGAAWVRNSGISPTGVYPDNLADGMPYSRGNYLMGLNLSWNVFDLWHQRDDKVEGSYMAKARASAIKDEALQLNQLLAQANDAYQSTQQKLQELPVQLRSAQQAFIQQSALFGSGLNTLVDVTNAQYLLQQAESNYVIAQDELLQLLYIRSALSGQSEIFLQNFKR